MRFDGVAHARGQVGRRIGAQEPAQALGIADGNEAEVGKQMLQRGNIPRRTLDPYDVGLLALRGCEQRRQQRTPMTAAARAEVDARQPKLVIGVDCAEEAESNGLGTDTVSILPVRPSSTK